MLFDLRGKRRRAVQVTYAGLALLMAVGLIGAGIGSDVSGGLFDLITGKNDSGDLGDANKAVQDRIEKAEGKLKVNPKDQAALVEVVRGHYSLATSDTKEDGTFGDKGKKELEKASAAWKRYLATNPEKVDPAFATIMLNAYGELGLNQPANGVAVAELVAKERNDSEAYLQLFQFATLASQQRKADLAAEKAVELAPEEERDNVKAYIKQAKAAPAGGGQGGTGQAPAPSGG